MAADPARGRRANPEDEEIAIAVHGAMPERQQRGDPDQWALWRDGNTNHSGPSEMTRFERDTMIIAKLLKSGRVNLKELSSYRTPVALLGQGDRVDTINSLILDIINNLAFSRRLILDCKLRRKSNAAESQKHERKLKDWSDEILQLQNNVEGLGGRYVRIPAMLLTPPELQN